MDVFTGTQCDGRQHEGKQERLWFRMFVARVSRSKRSLVGVHTRNGEAKP